MERLPDYATVVLDGYDATLEPGYITTDFEDGFKRQEWRNMAPKTSVSATIVLCNREDYQAFMCWVKEMRGGWWKWYDPTLTQDVRCRFTGSFRMKPVNKVLAGTRFEVACQFEHFDNCV